MEYNPSDLRKVHEIELDILRDIIRVCEENNLQYWVYGGTLIGTIRHNGFIPWDDDIDIGMMRDDYEKFLKIAPLQLKDGLTLQHYTLDSKTPTYFAKVRKNGTQFVEHYTRNMNIHHGIFVDIMPHDLIPENEQERAKYRKTAEWRKQLFIAKSVTETTITRGKRKIFIRTLERKILHFMLLPVSKKWLFNRLDSYMRQYNGSNSHMFTTRAMKVSENTLEDVFPLKKHLFEGLEVNIPNNYDLVLRRNYGDYMRLPSPEDQITHSPYILKFEE